MKFTETPLKGAYVLEMEPHRDERGYFARTWCREELEAHGLNSRLEQCSTSFNIRRGTLRGMHYQAEPYAEAKLVRCTRGALYDVIVDLRADSPTFKKWFAVELTASNLLMLYVPEGFAHGFQTLADETEVSYQISEVYRPEYARGVRWNDPAFEIRWPVEERLMSERDRSFQDFTG
ncbi:MAG: dTDP-4-dehydrorhamnose 3,5-epimerase [Pyrinomonadaceae bacterium]|nr:dTDP-4-dehydrorhamnose 3,5-epimerase [Pyrinomonadaceae bacterium]